MRPRLNPRATAIKGVICGVRVEEIEDPLMREIRYLDKLIDELAKGRPMSRSFGRRGSRHGRPCRTRSTSIGFGCADPSAGSRHLFALLRRRSASAALPPCARWRRLTG